MGVDFAAPYACLTIGYLEESRLFGIYAPQAFSNEQLSIIKKSFKGYMDDGFILWPSVLNIDILIDILGRLHENIKYTVEKGKIQGSTQTINMLDVKVILHDNTRVETEIYYKATNNHHYLEYDSFHPTHVKNNIPYNLAKRIIVFTSDPAKVEIELSKLKKWLIEVKYPTEVINKAFHNAKLQGPAPDPRNKKKSIPLISTHSSNFTNKSIVKQANRLLANCPDKETRSCFKDKRVIMATRQPPNLLRQLTSAKFGGNDIAPKGIYKCSNNNCKICRMYLKECKSFQTANDTTWHVQSHITCNSKLVIYYQVCSFFNKVSNIGKTNNLRLRINNHISACRSGNSTDKFDNHVHACSNETHRKEP